MKKLLTISILILTFFSCTKSSDGLLEPVNENTNKALNGTYSGILILDRQNTFNGKNYDWRDTLELHFSIALPTFTFTQGACFGKVVPKSDKISFDSNKCGCWCDCNPNVDCGGNLLLGTRFFSFDGDSLLMWASGNSRDSAIIPAVHPGFIWKEEVYLKKQ